MTAGSRATLSSAAKHQLSARPYYVEERGGERRYYDDYRRVSLAMRATATIVTSTRQDLTTVRAMLEIAHSLGWERLHIRGSAEFRREAWIEASARGLETSGFRPTDLERQEAERRRRASQPAPVRRLPATAAPPMAAAEKTHATVTEHRKILGQAQSELSPDGRLVLAALWKKIDRQMAQQRSEGRVELKAYVASELARKERADGPVVLSAAQRRAATAPEPKPVLEEERARPEARRVQPEAPRRTLAR